jgi:hypothetical protein
MRAVALSLASLAVLVLTSVVTAQPPDLNQSAVEVQPPPPPPPPPPVLQPIAAQPVPRPVGGLTVRGTSVGYIDTAAPGDQVFLRTDFGYGFAFPNRAEFFYAQSRPGGPGLPLPERSVDFQDLTVHAEHTLGERFSLFVEGGVRFLNPEVNANTAGLGDSAVGLKYAFLTSATGVASFQLRTFIPTGNPHRGLGTSHASLEPALLGFTRLIDRLGLAGELRYWVPLGGTDFAGSVFRYGLGLRYDLWDAGPVRMAPTAEVIGWTVLDGRQSRLGPGDVVLAQPAAGVTVVNAKIGARVDVGDRLGFYGGYGRPITGERWYSDVLRLEVRWLY